MSRGAGYPPVPKEDNTRKLRILWLQMEEQKRMCWQMEIKLNYAVASAGRSTIENAMLPFPYLHDMIAMLSALAVGPAAAAVRVAAWEKAPEPGTQEGTSLVGRSHGIKPSRPGTVRNAPMM